MLLDGRREGVWPAVRKARAAFLALEAGRVPDQLTHKVNV